VQRGAKFTRYLPEEGWECSVLTADPALVKHPKDYSLVQELLSGQKVHKVFTLDAQWLYKVFWGLRLPKVVTWLIFHVFIPDSEILWLPFAKARLKSVIKAEKPQLVYISGPPFSPMLLGKWLKDKYGIPYVLDFRDDWSLGQSRQDNPPPPAFRRIEQRLEHQAIANAAKVVVVNKAYKRDFLTLYPEQSEDKFCVITNGYDESDFAAPREPRTTKTDQLQIVHTGVLFARRHPGIIWQALENLIRSGRIEQDRIKVHLYGRNFESFVFRGFENSRIIRSIVELHPYLPHPQTITAMCQADLLLLFSGAGAKSEAELPGKLFEYLRAGKPILGVVNPRGVCAEILLQARSGVVASQEDLSQVEARIWEQYRLWQQGKLQIQPDWDYIRQFERRQLSKALAEVLNSITP